ncbi:hypothetical protein [Yersinia frederiksenii]|uniref:hypothetical protein n=1 Tax=Yersinia frederiksenii TaxID=29484 RepID=UPI0011AB23DE|nr:hypothetical protein [Yersinia frederiksenii]
MNKHIEPRLSIEERIRFLKASVALSDLLGPDELTVPASVLGALIARLEAAELELIKPLPIGELINRLEGQTYEKWFGESDVKDLRERAEAAEAQVSELKVAALVPGVLHCAKCKFQLTKTNLYFNSGTTGPGDNKTEPCPNGCGPLWPVTWRQWAFDASAAADKYFDELKAAEKERDTLLNQEFQQRLANAEHQLYMKDLAIHNIKASRKAQFIKRLAAEYALSAANEKLKAAEARLLVPVKLPSAMEYTCSGEGAMREGCVEAIRTAGFLVERDK